MSPKNTGPWGIHPNAVIVAIVGAALAIWIAGRNGSVVGGEGFFLLTLIVAAVVNRFVTRRH